MRADSELHVRVSAELRLWAALLLEPTRLKQLEAEASALKELLDRRLCDFRIDRLSCWYSRSIGQLGL